MLMVKRDIRDNLIFLHGLSSEPSHLSSNRLNKTVLMRGSTNVFNEE